jgi:hypothetical protein
MNVCIFLMFYDFFMHLHPPAHSYRSKKFSYIFLLSVCLVYFLLKYHVML